MKQPRTVAFISMQDGSAQTEQSDYVVGVDVGGSSLRLGLSDRSGRIVGKWVASTVGIKDAAVIVKMIEEGVDVLLLERGSSRSSLRAIAAGAPGITDSKQGIVIVTSYLMGWRDVPFRSMLEETFGVPAAVDNDVNLAALGESRAGAAREVSSFVFVAVGTGIGAGIILNGELFHGIGWTAGEIGYMLVPGTSAEPVDGGRPGAIEEIAGGEGIKSQWKSRWDESKTTLPQDAMATEIFQDAAGGNPLAQEVLNLAARTIAYAIYNTWLVLNCELFVLGGSIGLDPVFAEAVIQVLSKQSVRMRVQTVMSELGTDAQLVGAIHLALETAKTQDAVAAI